VKNQIPPEPQGSSPWAIAAKAIHAKLWGKDPLIKSTSDVIATKNSDGTTTLTLSKKSIVAGTSQPIIQYKITTIPAGKKDYVLATPFDGTSLVGAEIAIAKKIKYRPSITSVTILGTSITYVYADDNHRTSNDGVNPVQSEELYFPYEVDSGTTNGILLATQLSAPTGVIDGSSNPISWIELEDHVWAKYA
jgi:hypothetical protein